MARIETYGRDTVVTGLDKVIGTDIESGKATKNYEMSAIRNFVLEGASPEVGGQLKITSVIQDTPIPGTESPEALLNNLDPVLEINKYEVLIVRLSFNDSNNENKLTENVYLFNKVDVIVGFEEYESTSDDFILLSTKSEQSDVDYSGLITSVGLEGFDIYKGFNTTTNKHEIKRVGNVASGASVLYNNPLVSDNISQRGLTSTDLNITELDGIIQLDTTNINENVGNQTPVYKGYSASNKHEFRTIKSDNKTINLTLSTDNIDIELNNSFYITGDGQSNPITFESDFNSGTVSTLKSIIKDDGTTRFSRVEVKGRISTPSTLSFSSTIMVIPDSYLPLNLTNPLNNDVRFVVGNMIFYNDSGDIFEAILDVNNLGVVKMKYVKKVVDNLNVEVFADVLDVFSSIQVRGDINLDYFSRENYA